MHPVLSNYNKLSISSAPLFFERKKERDRCWLGNAFPGMSQRVQKLSTRISQMELISFAKVLSPALS
jgi:hypothetical protein